MFLSAGNLGFLIKGQIFKTTNDQYLAEKKGTPFVKGLKGAHRTRLQNFGIHTRPENGVNFRLLLVHIDDAFLSYCKYINTISSLL